MYLSIADRIKFSAQAIKKNWGVLAILGVFALGGGFLVFLAPKIETPIALYVFGGAFIGVSVFTFIITMPSSLRYFYDQAYIEKYGGYTTAKIIHKEIHDTSYTDDETGRVIEELAYLLTYSFTYFGETIEGTFYVSTRNCYDKIQTGTEIPIKFLKTKPTQSSVRRIKLANDLGLKRGDC